VVKAVATRFSPEEKAAVHRSFVEAEGLTRNFFRFSAEQWKTHRYEVKTLAHLEPHEKSDHAFAQLCKYVCWKRDPEGRQTDFHFFRICLQDGRILDAVKRGGSFIRFPALMLYIAVHELVHIVRFNRGESQFDLGVEEKEREEEQVHILTRRMLWPRADAQINLVLDCFGNDYRIGDLTQ